MTTNIRMHYSLNDSEGNSTYVEDLEEATGITVWVEQYARTATSGFMATGTIDELEDHYFEFTGEDYMAGVVVQAQEKAEALSTKYDGAPIEFY